LRKLFYLIDGRRVSGEVGVVDDCSADKTGAIADDLARQDERVQVAHHRVNQGKTVALKTGFALTRRGEVLESLAILTFSASR